MSNMEWDVVHDLLDSKEGVESMCSRQLRKLIAVLVVGLFFIQLIPVKPVSAAVDKTAYYNEIGKKLEGMANKYSIPPVLLKSIAWMESGWKQYQLDASGQPLLDQPLIGYDGIGIGIMQISSYDPNDNVTIDKLKNDIDYNIEVGCQILNQKWRAYPKIGNGDRNVLENWYFAVLGYNCWGARNNPNNLTGKSAYQESVFSLMGQKYNSAITFAPGATKISKSLLPLMDPPSLSSRWSTPTPSHEGDLLIDTNLLISSGGGSGTDAANGDYWYNFYIDPKRRGDYYIHALGFYSTAYNSPSVTDKSIVSQKIISSYGQILAEADALILKKTDSSDASAAKYYWTVLQGPSLDVGITERARTGLLSALDKLLDKADKLAIDGTGPSNVSAAQDYGIVLQGPSQDPGISDRAKTGLLSTYSKLLAEADKLLLEGTESSNASAAKYYSTVLQGLSLDADITERAKIGLQQTNNYTPKPEKNLDSDTVPVPDQTPKFTTLVRIAGSDRIDIANQQALAGWPQGASYVVLARSDDFPDALAGVPMAAQLDAPVLLTSPKELDSRVKEALKVLHPEKVYLLGGEGALSAKVSAELKTLGWDSEKQIRLSGVNRYATAAVIAQAITGVQNPKVAIATGENFPDALSIASIAGQKKMPVLLTTKNQVPQETMDALKQMKPSQVYLIGGEGVISPAVAKQIYSSLNLSSSSVTRLAGASRYETMAAVGKAFEGEIKAVCFATGEDFPNALTGAALATHQNETLILLPGQTLESHPELKEFITCHLSKSTTQPYLSGDVKAIPKGLEEELTGILGH